jgi:hypothetical protein
MTDADLLTAFEETSLAKENFSHREHVRVAWLFIRTYGLREALQRFPDALKRFATAKGAPQLYHETITWSYLFLIHDRFVRGRDDDEWATFAAANPELLTWKPSLIDRYYTAELLWSDRARASFVMPDRVVAPPLTGG